MVCSRVNFVIIHCLYLPATGINKGVNTKLCQFQPIMPVSTHCASFNPLCQFQPIMPVSTHCASFNPLCQFQPTVPVSTHYASFNPLCQFQPIVPVSTHYASFKAKTLHLRTTLWKKLQYTSPKFPQLAPTAAPNMSANN
jgi:hypothetical protein